MTAGLAPCLNGHPRHQWETLRREGYHVGQLHCRTCDRWLDELRLPERSERPTDAAE